MIRPAAPADLDQLLRIEQAAFTGDRLSRRGLRAQIGHPRNRVIVAEAEGRPAAYALLLLPRAARWARLYSIAVDPGWAGRGFGRSLLARAEAAAAAQGRAELRLEVRADNAAAIALYRTSGYREFGRYTSYYEDETDALRFVKSLAGASDAGRCAHEGQGAISGQ